jgi:hypothetical protein
VKPPPDLTDDELMLKRGKIRTLYSARKDATECLRDAYTAMQAAPWSELHTHASNAREAAERLATLAAMWDEVNE